MKNAQGLKKSTERVGLTRRLVLTKTKGGYDRGSREKKTKEVSLGKIVVGNQVGMSFLTVLTRIQAGEALNS